MGATIRIEGVEEILKKLDPAILEPVVRAGFGEIASIAKPEIASRIPVDTGLLAGSVRVQVDSWRQIPEYVKIGPTMPHTHLMELGVQPGHFPPWNDPSTKSGRRLRIWARMHFAPTDFGSTARKTARKVTRVLSREERKDARESALDRATFLLARAISRHGIKPRRFLHDAFTSTESHLDGVVTSMVDHLEAEWAKVGGPRG